MKFLLGSVFVVSACLFVVSSNPAVAQPKTKDTKLAATSTAVYPPGMISFFVSPTTTSCPNDWAALTGAQGRLLLAVEENSSVIGTSIGGTSLTGPEPPTHNHGYSASFDLTDSHRVEPTGSGGPEIAKPKTYDLTGTVDSADLELPFIQYLVCESSSTPTGADTLPFGAISFFTYDSCPTNWSALVTTDDGFLVVPTPQSGKPSTKPNIEDGWPPSSLPPHSHTFGGNIDLNEIQGDMDVSDKGARWTTKKCPMTVPATGSAGPHGMGLPMIPYILCLKTPKGNTPPSGQSFEKGMTIFTAGTCKGTGGFTQVTGSAGRLLVGCNGCTAGGTNPLAKAFGATSSFGGSSTSYSALHSHSHSGKSAGDSIKQNKGLNATRFVKSSTQYLSGTTNTSSVSLPAFTLTHCEAP